MQAACESRVVHDLTVADVDSVMQIASAGCNQVGAQGRLVSQGKARGECVSILPGRYQNASKTIAS